MPNELLRIEAALLLIAAMIAARPLFSRGPLTRGARPLLLLGLLVWTALLLLLLWQRAEALHLLFALSLLLGVILLLVGRPSFGMGSGLPPGSLSPLHSLRALIERDFYYEQAQRHGKIFKMSQFHRLAICIVDLPLGHELLRVQRQSLTASVQPFTHDISNGFLRYMEGAQYAHYGPLFQQALSRKLIGRLRPAIERSVAANFAELHRAGSLAAGNCSLHLEQVTYDAFLVALFGATAESDFYRRFTPVYRRFERHAIDRRLSKRTLAELEQLRRLICDHGDERLPECVLAELARLNEGIDLTCIDNLLYIMKIAIENVTGALVWLLYYLQQDAAPLQRVRLAADLEEKRQWQGAIVAETLRLAQSEYLYRTVAQPFTFAGYRFPKGSLIRICVRESHLDAERFPNPRRFDPARFLERRYKRSHYAPFGHPPHACNGASLTHALAGSVVAVLAERYEVEPIDAGRLQFGLRHWRHWSPDRNLRIGLSARPAAQRASPLQRATAEM